MYFGAFHSKRLRERRDEELSLSKSQGDPIAGPGPAPEKRLREEESGLGEPAAKRLHEDTTSSSVPSLSTERAGETEHANPAVFASDSETQVPGPAAAANLQFGGSQFEPAQRLIDSAIQGAPMPSNESSELHATQRSPPAGHSSSSPDKGRGSISSRKRAGTGNGSSGVTRSSGATRSSGSSRLAGPSPQLVSPTKAQLFGSAPAGPARFVVPDDSPSRRTRSQTRRLTATSELIEEGEETEEVQDEAKP